MCRNFIFVCCCERLLINILSDDDDCSYSSTIAACRSVLNWNDRRVYGDQDERAFTSRPGILQILISVGIAKSEVVFIKHKRASRFVFCSQYTLYSKPLLYAPGLVMLKSLVVEWIKT